MKRLLTITLSLLLALAARSQASDSLRASLLTCAPGAEAYELYGHTALRVTDLTTGNDWVFNYGLFHFSDGFVWRFVLGQTDYALGVSTFADFCRDYAAAGRAVSEQQLNLTQAEAASLFAALIDNAQPEHCIYRYNFLTDNCTSRAIAKIAVVAPVSLPADDGGAPVTYRQVIHRYAAEASPWTAFGQDLLLGCAVDTPLTTAALMMFPLEAEALLRCATVVHDGRTEPLVGVERLILDLPPVEQAPFPLSPLAASVLVLAASVLLSWRQLRGRSRRLVAAFDVALLLLQGVAGCIVCTLFFFSEHPAVGSNWLIGVLNPLPLLGLPLTLTALRRRRADVVMPTLGTATALLGLGANIFQYIPLPMNVLALSLLLRGLSSLCVLRSASRKARHTSAPTA